MPPFKRTKIVATLGPATDDKEVIRALAEAGADVFRLNFSHGAPEDHRRRVGWVREVAEELGRTLAVLQDLMHEIVEKSVLGGERGKSVVLVPAEPSASRRNPENALTVLVHRRDGIARESLLRGERREAAF